MFPSLFAKVAQELTNTVTGKKTKKNQTKRGMYKQETITGYQKKYSHRLLV